MKTVGNDKCTLTKFKLRVKTAAVFTKVAKTFFSLSKVFDPACFHTVKQ